MKDSYDSGAQIGGRGADRLGEMEVFVRILERGNFSAAARDLRLTPSGVSRVVSRLESRLGAKLITRTTRRIEATPEGPLFFERCVELLAGIDDAEQSVTAQTQPRGKIRVSASIPFGRQILTPLLARFLALYPKIHVELTLTDQVVNLLQERTDVAIRHGELNSSSLMARRLGRSSMMVVASPAYIEAHGRPLVPSELTGHDCLDYGYVRAAKGWPFRVDGVTTTVAPVGSASASDGETLRQLVLAGIGIARLERFQVIDDITAGRLVPLLEQFNPEDHDPIHVVFTGDRERIPGRVRVFIDFLVTHVDVNA